MRRHLLVEVPHLAALGTPPGQVALADGLADVPGLSVPTPDTNIVMVDAADAGMTGDEFADLCHDAGIQCGAFGPTTVRLCTHLDVSRSDVAEAVERIAQAMDAA